MYLLGFFFLKAVKVRADIVKQDKKKKKKEKKRKRESEMNGVSEDADTTADLTVNTTADLTVDTSVLEEPPKKKKKKKKKKSNPGEEWFLFEPCCIKRECKASAKTNNLGQPGSQSDFG